MPAGYVEWYNPESGQVELLEDPDYHPSPYEAAEQGGYLDEFEDYTEDIYATPQTPMAPGGEAATAAGVNLYDRPSWDNYSGPFRDPTILAENPTQPTPTPQPTPPRPTPTVPRSSGPMYTANEGDEPDPGGGEEPYFTYDPFVPPEWNMPAWTDPAPFSYGEFSYAPYEAMTMENFQADPGYEFRQNEMARTVNNAASATGRLRSPATLKALMGYAGGLASQEYGNVEGRRFRTHQANRQGAFDAHNANRGAAFDTHNANVRDQRLNWMQGYNSEADEFNRGLSTYTTNFNSAAAQAGLNLDARNSQFGNYMSLYDLTTGDLLPPVAPTY